MAQVAMAAPTNIMEMFSSPSMMLGDIAQSQLDQYRQVNDLNMKQSLEDLMYKQQTNPIKAKQEQAALDTTLAQLPGIQAQSRSMGVKANIDEATQDPAIKAKLVEFAKNTSDNELAQTENIVKAQLLKAKPGSPEYRQAEQMWGNLSSIRELKLKQAEETKRAYGVAGIQAQAQKDVMQQQIDAGRFKNKYNTGIEIRLDTETDPVKKYQMLLDASRKAEQQGNIEEAQAYMERATNLQNLVKAKLSSAQPKPGTADIGALGVQTNPALDIAPGLPMDTTNFSDEAAAEAAYKAGKLKPGDIITINGKKAKVK